MEVLTFKDFLQEQYATQTDEFKNYIDSVDLLEQKLSGRLDEALIDLLPPASRMQYDFISALAEQGNLELKDLITLFKDSRVYTFFKKIGWDLKRLYELLEKGYETYIHFQHIIWEYTAKTGVTKWTDKELVRLQAFLEKHPTIKKLGGPLIACLLLWLWFDGTHVLHAHDFDFTEIFKALDGDYDVADLLGGGKGIRILFLMTTALTGIGFHYSSPKAVNFIGALIYSLHKTLTST